MISQGVTNFIAGGAIGFDTIAALTVLGIRKKNPNIKLILYLPCKEQEISWGQEDKETYNLICSQADEVVYISKKYFSGCMHKRNRAMVDASDYCIAYLDKLHGGTYDTLNYARSKGAKIIDLSTYL